MERLARLADRRARWTLTLGAALFVFAGFFGAGVAERLDPFADEDPGTESVIADSRLEAAGFRPADLLVLVNRADVRSQEGQERVEAIGRRLEASPDVASVTGYLETGSRDFVSADGDSTYLAIALAPTDDGGRHDAAERIAAALADVPGIAVGGAALAESQVNEQAERDLRRAELYAFPLLFLLSLLFFRGLVAALLPLMVGALSILGTFLMLRVASELGSISIFALNVTVGLGLGLAIDYSLFIVSRYREEIARTGPGLEAMRTTLGTAGRTVLFSALTVAGALASLLVFPQRFLYSMGIAGFFVALIAATISLTVLPAVLTLLGRRVNALAPSFLGRRASRDAAPPEAAELWHRLARATGRFPGRVAVAAGVLLVALGFPFAGVQFTGIDAGVLPQSASARQVHDAIRADFPPYRDTPITLAVRGGPAEASRVGDAAARLPGATAVSPPRELTDGTHVVTVVSDAPPLADSSRELVRELRALPGDALVTGTTAHYVDLQQSLRGHLPVALGIVAAITLAALFAMTGSLVLPLVQVAMNALGLGAVLGILVLVFQDGRLEGLLGYTSQGGLEATQLLFLLAVGFGLSTDYGIFLLSRIKEARDRGLGNARAIAVGVERTGRIITAAALLFSIAVGAFATSEIVVLKVLGLGMALAVLLDATIIRALLVPSLLRLLGRASWWAPSPLRRLHARIGLSGA